MKPGAKNRTSWQSVFANCLESESLVESEERRIRLSGAEGTSLTLTGWNPSHAAIRIREKGKPGGVFHLPGLAQGSDRHRIADYILFAEIKGAHYAIIVEMKKTLRPGNRGGYRQVRATRPVVAYLKRLARDEGSRSGPVALRHVVVAAEPGDRLPKSPPRPEPIQAGCRWNEDGVHGLRFLAEQLPVEALVEDPKLRCECPDERRPGC